MLKSEAEIGVTALRLPKMATNFAIDLTRSSLYFRKPRGRSRPRDHIPKLASEYGRWEARGASCATVFTDVILAASHQHRLSPALWTTLSGHLPTPPAMSDMHPCLPLHQAHCWVRAYTQQGAGGLVAAYGNMASSEHSKWVRV